MIYYDKSPKNKGGYRMKIKICIGSSCHLRGSETVVKRIQELVKEQGMDEQIELGGSFCMGKCSRKVSVKVDDEIYHIGPEEVDEIFFKIIGKEE